MRRALFLPAVVLAILGSASGAHAAPLPPGHYTGEMIETGQAMRVGVDLAADGRASFTSLSQAVMNYPFDVFTQKEDAIHFVLGGAMIFDGKVTDGRVEGSFTTPAGDSGGFHLEAEPAEPLPYSMREVIFHHGAVTLSGSLLVPKGPGKHPGVVLLHGSGPQTRWGTQRFLADRFARAGVVTLLYDKRGSGRSSGTLDGFTYDDLAGDALAGVRLLASSAAVDPRAVGLVGHSEGGITGVVAAAAAPGEVAFLVAEDTVAGLVYQQDVYRVGRALRQEKLDPDEIRRAMAVYLTFVDVARGVKPYEDLDTARALYGQTRWFEWLGIPPRDAPLWRNAKARENLDTLVFWHQLHIPVLLVYGEKDELAPVSDSIAVIEGVLPRPDLCSAVIAPDAEHNLTVHPAPGGPFFWWKTAPGIADLVASWVRARGR